ncbi:MAG TPA: family 20 glycosylhydrolase, partial [Cytophagales bacterium]|nr:family 20 glycosylhydrolase [Cytophagales bacterium]
FVSVKDQPAFKWRGGMLDVSRHFFPVSFVKKYIDLLASYKLNTFHWHLTDDQGWRIEIKKYPKLTQISSNRKETLIGAQQILRNEKKEFIYDGTPYGGFYTQEEVKDVVAYAQKRYVTIVPEIEMPGHSVAVLAAYPELACKPGDYEVLTKWGISKDIVCPSEETFQFFENVLSEVVQLFPGKYVHIGGDEAPKDVWKESPEVAKIMKKNKIKDVEKVQGWFNARIEKFLESKGKKLIGWDEILEGGISPSSTIMSWRGEKGGIEAAKHGNTVVMSPTTHFYLDYGQNPIPHNPKEPLMICCYLPIEKVYSYNPLSKELTQEQHKYILGVQANLWTEYIPTAEKAEYMLFPRLLALSEVAWTPYEKKDFESFENRLSEQFLRLDLKDVNYRIPQPTGLDSESIVKQGDKVIITLNSIVPNSEIRYTLDGHTPDETTHLYTKPIAVPSGRKIKVSAVTIAPNGRHSVPVELVID